MKKIKQKFEREMPLIEVTFTCVDCGETFTREQYPGRTPERCEGCKEKHEKALNRARVKAYRERKKNAENSLCKSEFAKPKE